MSSLFSMPKTIPMYDKKIAIYRTTQLKTLSPRESTVARYFEKRLSQYKEIFGLRESPRDIGDTLLFAEKEFDLEVYKASDSFWWISRNAAFPETLKDGAKLPDMDTAAENARKRIERLGVDVSCAEVQSVSYTEVVRDDTKQREIQRENTAVNVNFSFNLNGLPVVGAGAKMQISYCDYDELAHILYFWRNIKEEDAMEVILPDNALEKLMKDPRFIRLDDRNAKVSLNDIQLGYYALPPYEFQRFLIPVYTITGTASTKYLERYDFTSHVVAVNITASEIKKAGIVANPDSCQVF